MAFYLAKALYSIFSAIAVPPEPTSIQLPNLEPEKQPILLNDSSKRFVKALLT